MKAPSEPLARTRTSLGRAPAISSGVGAYLETLIRTQLAPGDRLPPERELADTLDVSRTTVREALQHLQSRRLIERRPGRGTTVAHPPQRAAELEVELGGAGPDDVDVAELRLVIEPHIAALAAERASDAEILLLDDLLTASHSGLTPSESLVLDMRFHEQLALASHNPLLASLCGLTNTWVRDVRARSHRSRAGRRMSVEGHRAILMAVVDHDGEAATAAMVDHLHEVARFVAAARTEGRS